MRTREEVTKVAKEIKRELKNKFPSINFSVRTKRYSLGESISIRWYDGPAQKRVEEITQAYDDIDRDERTGEILAGGNRYVFCERDMSYGIEEIIKEYSKYVDVGDPNSPMTRMRAWKIYGEIDLYDDLGESMKKYIESEDY